MKKRTVMACLLALPLLVGACSGTPGATASASTGRTPVSSTGVTKTSQGGEVTVVASWSGPTAGATFDVKLDTHSVDLDTLDLSSAVLRNDRGEVLVARTWAAAKGGHHREGTLAFAGDTSTFLLGARWIELSLTDVGGVPERTLRWEIGS